MARFLIFLLIFYLIYFLVKTIFIKPFREGYSSPGDSSKSKNWSPFGRKEGNVSISYDPRKDGKQRKEVGEYIDYEEVKD